MASKAFSAGEAASSKLSPHFWVGDEVHLSSSAKERTPSSAPTAGSTAAGPSRNAEPLPPASSLVTMGLAAICLLLLGYLLGNMRTGAERLETEIGAVAQYGLFKGLKPGMHENLDKVLANMQTIEQVVDQLSKEHIAALTGDAAAEKKKQWNAVLDAYVKTARDVQLINQVYSLTPEEAAAVQQLINQKEAETAAEPHALRRAGESKRRGRQTERRTG